MRWTVLSSALAVEFAIYADCGSTGTRVYLIEAGEQTKVEKIGKASAMTGDRVKALSSFSSLVDKALARIPPNVNVSVNALGTAGMRGLDEGEQAAVWSALEQELRREPARSARLQRLRLRTISGTEEGYYGLVSANYLSGLAGLATESKPVGTLDLGGSSTQVAVPKPRVSKDAFIRSYPWGMERARQRLAPAACFLADSSEAPEGAPRGDAAACRAAIQAGLLEERAACDDPPCLGEPVEWDDVGLMALSGLFYAADFADWALRTQADGQIPGYPSPRFEDLERAADFLCRQSEATLAATTPAHPFTGPQKLPHRCFEINYQIELFKLYGIPDDGRIMYVDTIHGHDVEWTLGAHLASSVNGSTEL